METATFESGKVQAPEMNIPAFSRRMRGFHPSGVNIGVSR
jgi:hypothetical protein